MKKFVSFHLLSARSLPSNLNRDEAGSPKSSIVGGTMRSRESSQSIKRAWRMRLGESEFGEFFKDIRTAKFDRALVKCLASLGGEPNMAAKLAEAQWKAMLDGGKERMIFIAPSQVKAIAVELLRKGSVLSPKEVSDVLRSLGVPVDALGRILWGSMFPGIKEVEVRDSVTYVTHAISTNAMPPQPDYLTALDDLARDEGAPFIDVQEFTCPVMFRMFAIEIAPLMEAMDGYVDDDTKKAILTEIIISGLLASPNGKQHSMASDDGPCHVVALAWAKGSPYTMGRSFSRHVDGDDHVAESIKRLDDHIDKQVASFHVTHGLSKIGKPFDSGVELTGWVKGVVDAILA